MTELKITKLTRGYVVEKGAERFAFVTLPEALEKIEEELRDPFSPEERLPWHQRTKP